eukprot:scaffold2671_cov164-Chaetoceros_neogracile.AAC.3
MLTGDPPFVDKDPMGIYKMILGGRLSFPRGFNKAAKSLIKKLLTHDLTKRYGCMKNGARDVKKAKWFAEMIWADLTKKEIEAPIIPEVAHESDTSNFDEYPDSDTDAHFKVECHITLLESDSENSLMYAFGWRSSPCTTKHNARRTTTLLQTAHHQATSGT